MNRKLNVCPLYFLILTAAFATFACGSESDLSLTEVPLQNNELGRVSQPDQSRFKVFEHREARVVKANKADIESSDIDDVEVKPVEPILLPANGYCCNTSTGSVSKTPQSGCKNPNNWYTNLAGCLGDAICGRPSRNCYI